MRILVLNHEYPPLGGGASPVSRGLCEELARRGHEVDVVTMGFRALPRTESVEKRLRVFRVPCLRRARHLCHTHEMLTYVVSALVHGLRLLRAHDYDLIHAHFILPAGVVAFLLHHATGVPYVVTVHGSDVPGYNPDRFRRSHRWLAPFWRRIAAGARTITSPSAWLGTLLARSLPGAPLRCIPNGIRSDWVVPAVKQRNLLVVSRLFERKGVQCLLRALQGTPIGYTVHVVGDGPYRDELETMARDLGVPVVFHGWLPNDSAALGRLYATSEIFVFPSSVENFPMCLLEAMLAGATIVASDIPSCHEALGAAARYFPPGDAAALRACLVQLAGDAAARAGLAVNARQRVLDRFVWPRIGMQFEALFQQVSVSEVPATVSEAIP